MDLALEKQTWTVLGPIHADPGSFGQVFEVRSGEGEVAVAKLVPKSPGAEREILIGDSIRAAQFQNVVPILDSGEHQDFWVLVMAKADMSLAQYLSAQENRVGFDEAVQILLDIATALAEINGEIVHRDIKPANVLLHEGKWKLADFGISRYAETNTSEATRKRSFTPLYAAPEQWEHRRANEATDVYAFGVLGFELLSGARPFTGNSVELREQHLKSAPPEVSGVPARMRILIEECLYKEPDIRPRPGTILVALRKVRDSPQKSALSKLADVSHIEIRERARQQAVRNAEQEQVTQLTRKVEAAARALDSLVRPLKDAIEENAPTAIFEPVVGNAAPIFRVRLRDAALEMSRVEAVSEWRGPFAILAFASISVISRSGRDHRAGRSHSLWYCDAKLEGHFAWHELAFMESPLKNIDPDIEPFACSPWEGEQPFLNVTGGRQLAWPVTKIDRADPTEFLNRWLGWFADAAVGKLQEHSEQMDIGISGSWRRK